MKSFDPYETCPCFSGKKIKFCKSKTAERTQRVAELMQNGQVDLGLVELQRVVADAAEPACQAYAGSLEIMSYISRNDVIGAARFLESICDQYPDLPGPLLARAKFHRDIGNPEGAFALEVESLSRIPANLQPLRQRILFNIAAFEAERGQPLAAWSRVMEAQRLGPIDGTISEFVDAAIGSNPMLPRAVQLGLSLRSPDVLNVFSEDRREKWDRALAERESWHLDDVAMTFEYLAEDDPSDLAARYNLALVRAWMGENDKAVEAMERYIDAETDFESAASAADICEILRRGWSAGEQASQWEYQTSYQIIDLEALQMAFDKIPQVYLLRMGESKTIHLMDQPLREYSQPDWIGPQSRWLAELVLTPQALVVRSFDEAQHAQACELMESALGSTAEKVHSERRIRELASADIELSAVYVRGKTGEEQHADRVRYAQDYFLNDWIRRPNPSLGGLAPIDAAGSERFRKRLEGLVRFHERSVSRFLDANFFGRLRNQLGLESIVTEPGRDLDIVSIADYSVGQLGELKEFELSDENLLLAYQTALRLDAPTTAERFARVILQRPSMGQQIDRVGVCARLADMQLAEGAPEQAERILRAALADSSLSQAADAKAKLEGLLAKCLLERGQTAEAVDLYRDIFGRSNNLEVVAAAVEAMMRIGQWSQAQEFAEFGLKQAEELRERDFQGQFRSYLEEIRARSR